MQICICYSLKMLSFSSKRQVRAFQLCHPVLIKGQVEDSISHIIYHSRFSHKWRVLLNFFSSNCKIGTWKMTREVTVCKICVSVAPGQAIELFRVWSWYTKITGMISSQSTCKNQEINAWMSRTTGFFPPLSLSSFLSLSKFNQLKKY